MQVKHNLSGGTKYDLWTHAVADILQTKRTFLIGLECEDLSWTNL